MSIDFSMFERDPTGKGKDLELPVRSLTDPAVLLKDQIFVSAVELCGLDPGSLLNERGRGPASWTLAVLEDLKEKALDIRTGRLRWVLRTAMPLKPGFALFLNTEKLTSSKKDFERVIEFQPGDIADSRLEALNEKTGEEWSVVNGALRSPTFSEGVRGKVIVTERSLHAGKSSDLGRSHGFFIRVRGRLVNEKDPLFGLSPRSYKTFNRFRADLDIDDLDEVLTAPREGVEESGTKRLLEHALAAIFSEARERYENYIDEEQSKEKRQREHDRNFVNPRLVEHPVADALAQPDSFQGSDADEAWFYLDIKKDVDLHELARHLYSSSRERYTYKYVARGRPARLVSFAPEEGVFSVNEDHDFSLAHLDHPRSRLALEDIVTAEALLEVYFREIGLDPHKLGEVLELRDSLLRSLAQDHPFSLRAIARHLRDAANDEHDLEQSLVTATRALGFVAKHVSGAGEPDGIARLREYPGGEKKITLEAKASKSMPELANIDFAGLAEHRNAHEADGCLLVAPKYPGSTRGDESSASHRARENAISCWTVDDFARVVESAEGRHITAQQVLDIVLRKFTPGDVKSAVDELFEKPTWEATELYSAILDALIQLEGRLADSPRTIDHVAAEVSRDAQFREIERKTIEKATRQLAAVSQGSLTVRDSTITLNTSTEELGRRLSHLTSRLGGPRRTGRFGSED